MLKVLENSVEESVKLDQLWPIGHYAVGIKFRDGHDSGIFTFELLNQLATNSSIAD